MKLITLGEIADVKLGKMLSPVSKTGTAYFPYLRNQNVQWFRFDLRDMAEMDFSEGERLRFRLKSGDLLICEGGEPGRCAVWQGEITDCYYQKAIHRVRPKNGKADPHFLAYWIWYQCKFTSNRDNDSRTTIAHLPLNQLLEFPVPALPLCKQEQIVSVLRPQFDCIQNACLAARTQLAELDLLPQKLLGQSQRTRRCSLGDVLVEVKEGIGPKWADFPVLGATRAGLAPAKESPGKHAHRYKPVTAGTVFYNPMRILIGSIAFLDEGDHPGITSPDYVVLKGAPGIVDSRWFYYWLRSPWGEQCIQSLARGAVRERMLFNRLAEGEIELPDYDSQVKASKAMSLVRPSRTAIQTQLAELDLLPQKLLAQVFGT